MSEAPSRRLVFLVPLALVLAVALTTGARPGGPAPTAGPPAAPAAAAADWPEVERLIGEQKFAEALTEVERLGDDARRAGDAPGWTKALVRATQLRVGLHGYETAVRALREAPWPDDRISRAALSLTYAHALTTYLDAYSWEIHRREAVAVAGPLDLKSWTAPMIRAEAERAYLEVWQKRAALGTAPVASLAEVFEPNSYPPDVRGTLRDAVSYLYAALLADSSGWTPEHDNELFRLDLARLLADGAGAEIGPGDPAVHPLASLAAVLDDLERWHLAAGRRAAGLEARLERARRLHAAFTDDDDRRAIRADLERRLAGFRGDPWWAEGTAVLAELTSTDAAPDALVRARELALGGRRAYPDSVGGRHCESIVAAIEAPAVVVRSMASDGPGRRSLEVTHKNLNELHFRAYAADLVKRLETSEDYNLLPDADDIRTLMAGAPPLLSWKVDLPPTPDFREHRTFVTPPLSAAGFYVVLAAPDAALSGDRGPLVATTLLLSDLVLLSRTTADGDLEARVVAGSTGVPQGGVRVDLYRRDWQRGHRPVANATTGADGWVRFPLAAVDEGRSYFLLARRGGEAALDGDGYWLSRPARPTRERAALLFTDRSIYRPGQRLFWKVLAWQGDPDAGRLRTAPEQVVTVRLRDANGEEVAARTVTTSAFGSASGDFELPPGRLLGTWRLDSTLGGGLVVRVEEYKRPTFEVAIADPIAPLRLNREARLAGNARYYFGLPVTDGAVRWRVTREPVWPRWRWWGERKAPQTIAAGTARLDADGAFPVAFTPRADERLGLEVSYRYLLSADVTDAGGETRSATRAFRLGFVAVEASVSAARGFFPAGQAVELTVSRASLDGQPRPGSGSWVLVELRQPVRPPLPADLPPRRSRPGPEPVLRAGTGSTTTEGDRLRPRWETEYAPDEVLRSWPDGRELGGGALDHGGLSTTVKLDPLSPGAYRLRYRTTDEFGAACEAQHEFVVAAPTTAVALPALLLLESSSVPVGGTARLLALSGLPGQPLVLERFRGGAVVERRSLTAGRDATVIEIPVREVDRGGFSVALSTVADHQLVQLQQTVSVPWDDRRLEVAFATFRDRLRPGQRESWRITVRGADGVPLGAGAAELLATMIDRSLDAFVPHRLADPLSLYPDRTGTRPLRASLGEGPMHWLRGSFPAPPSPPDLRGDRVKVLDRYGIGGPGRRGGPVGGVLAMESRALAPAPMAKQARDAAEADEAAERTEVASAAAPAAELRSEFAETAFWQPQLLTGADGSVALEFTVPDSLTAWNVMVAAVTRDLRAGSLVAEARTVKELMVRPYLPRFLREGDQAELQVVVNNAAAHELAGEVSLDLLDPDTGESVLGRFGVNGTVRRFTVAPAASDTVAYRVTAPAAVGAVAVKITARAGDLADGELRPLPLLPGRLHLAQSRFAALRGDERRTLRFADLERDDDPTRASERLVVTVDGQLFDGVLAALPYLVHYPYECTEQTLNRFLSTGIVSAVLEKYPAVARRAAELSKRETRFETFDGADPNRRMGLEETPWLREARGGRDEGLDLVNVLDARVARAERAAALAKLVRAQTSNGGFPWFPGGPPSPYMTVYVLYGFAKAAEFGVEVPREPVVRGWGYLAEHVREELQRAAKDDCCWHLLTFINYVASCYPDLSWLGDALSDDDRSRMLELSLRHWKEHSPYLKGMLALTLARAGRLDDARRVWASVMDSARTETDLGTFWAPEDRAWLWYNDTIETHAFALRVLLEISPQDARRHGLVHWLFLNKKLNQWKSTRATAEVIYALVHYLDAEGALSGRERVDVAVGGRSASFAFEPDAYTGKRNQLVLEGAQVTPAAATIEVSKSGAGMAFASATWHFATDRLPERGDGDLFRVERRYFRRDRTAQGAVLTPLAEGAAIAVGDEIEVQLSVRAAHAAEYVHLRDPRPAGCEPGTQLSGWRWDLGLVRYEEIRDSGTNFFFEWLPAGEYRLSYRVRAATAGTFRVAPATLQSMYAPEFAAHSAGATLAIGGR